MRCIVLIGFSDIWGITNLIRSCNSNQGTLIVEVTKEIMFSQESNDLFSVSEWFCIDENSVVFSQKHNLIVLSLQN